ncbi:MAG: hypothetical protein LPK05_06540 [Rhodobacterales bacterium]|nr:hypothetical protein [Rhodobacterales bacterium]
MIDHDVEMDTGAMLADQLDRVLRELDGPARMRAEAEGAAPDLLTRLEALGLETALVPEAKGGVGLSWQDMTRVFLALGYHAAPAPLGEAVIARWAMARLGQTCTAPLPGIALDRVRETGDGKVSGRVQVPWQKTAGPVLAVTTDDRLVLIDAVSFCTCAQLHTLGRDPALRVVFQEAPILASVADVGFGLGEAMALLRAAQIAGGLSRILEMTIDYGNTRVQFGKPIGKFQAVQHLVAGLAGEAACARTAVDMAMVAADRGDDWRAIAVAKIRAGMAVPKANFAAHQSHGAIGVTEEHTLHHFTRRLMQWREEAGDEFYWSERLGQAAVQSGGAGLWPMIVELSGGG